MKPRLRVVRFGLCQPKLYRYHSDERQYSICVPEYLPAGYAAGGHQRSRLDDGYIRYKLRLNKGMKKLPLYQQRLHRIR